MITNVPLIRQWPKMTYWTLSEIHTASTPSQSLLKEPKQTLLCLRDKSQPPSQLNICLFLSILSSHEPLLCRLNVCFSLRSSCDLAPGPPPPQVTSVAASQAFKSSRTHHSHPDPTTTLGPAQTSPLLQSQCNSSSPACNLLPFTRHRPPAPVVLH